MTFRKEIIRSSVKKINFNHSFRSFVTSLQTSTTEKKIIRKNRHDKGVAEIYHYTWNKKFCEVPFDANNNPMHICYSAIAEIEFPRQKKFDENGNLLNREDRVNKNHVPVIIVQENKSTAYLVIISSYHPDTKRIEQLIGTNYVTDLTSTDTIPSDFFVWLYYSYNQNKPVLNQDFTLNNLVGFTGTIVSDDNKITESSDSTSDLLITKAFVSNLYPLNSLKFDCSYNCFQSVLTLDKNLSLVLDLNHTDLFFDSLSTNGSEEKAIRAISYFYSSILPALLEDYKKKKSVFSKNKDSFSKKIGIEVIESIIEKNKISASEIKFP